MITKFRKRVFAIVRKIPRGKPQPTEQCKNIAHKPRAVGQALKTNKDYKNIPCHRL